MAEIETDYLVVGAGASAMAFVDSLLAGSDARVVMVDRRHAPGGHWLDAYPFVRLHQPSAVYGVASRRLGEDRIDASGPNAGFYERARADEIRDYFARVMDRFTESGRVRFLACHDFRGQADGGGHAVSLVDGAETAIRARKLVDATYIASEVPARHVPAFAVDPDARLLAPHQLVDLDQPAGGFVVIGAGKTAMDTCCWLLDQGVDPDRIQWIRPREPWMFDRRCFQPLELVAAYMDMQARWMEAAAEATDGADLARRLEASGVFLRIDPEVEPEVYRGPIVSTGELEAMRSVERVVRMGHVRGAGGGRITLDRGEISVQPGAVLVDCTAAGVRVAPARPVFEGDRIIVQYITISGASWGAATIGMIEASGRDDAEKNRLCPPIVFSGNASDLVSFAYAGLSGIFARLAEPDFNRWNDGCRLNPALGASERLDDPQVAAAFASVMTNAGPAMRNLARRAAGAAAPA